jgi:hypothetical protein
MNANRSQRGQALPSVAAAFVAIALVGVAFAVLVFRLSASFSNDGASVASPAVSAPAPSKTPAASPSSPAPSKTPTAIPVAVRSAAPSKAPPVKPSDLPSRIALESSTGQHVVAALTDQTGTLTGAVSGHPGDGMSVRWHDAIVTQAGPNAIKVTWAALPLDANHVVIQVLDRTVD